MRSRKMLRTLNRAKLRPVASDEEKRLEQLFDSLNDSQLDRIEDVIAESTNGILSKKQLQKINRIISTPEIVHPRSLPSW